MLFSLWIQRRRTTPVLKHELPWFTLYFLYLWSIYNEPIAAGADRWGSTSDPDVFVVRQSLTMPTALYIHFLFFCVGYSTGKTIFLRKHNLMSEFLLKKTDISEQFLQVSFICSLLRKTLLILDFSGIFSKITYSEFLGQFLSLSVVPTNISESFCWGLLQNKTWFLHDILFLSLLSSVSLSECTVFLAKDWFSSRFLADPEEIIK